MNKAVRWHLVPPLCLVVCKGTVKLEVLVRGHLRHLCEAVPSQELAHLQQQVLAGDGGAHDMSESSGHGPCCLVGRASRLNVGTGLVVFAAGDHYNLSIRRCGWPTTRTSVTTPHLRASQPSGICRSGHLEREVQRCPTVATIEEHPKAAGLRQMLDQQAVKFIVTDLPCSLEVARDQGVILAGDFISAPIGSAAAVTTVVQKQLVSASDSLGEPTHGREYVGLGRHHVCAIIPQSTDLAILELEGLLQDSDHRLGIVDAA
mmetsp:Transcript_54703/g.130676  ORF Transcript_54703/g.130676 Transcript_54703/m.130676 type:complete len:261 (+) Transcript_54703:347-1129(+)